MNPSSACWRPPFHWQSLRTSLHTNKPTVWGFLIFFTKDCKFLINFLRTYYTFLSTLDYKYLFNYLKLWQKLCHIKLDHLVHIICSKCPPSGSMLAFRRLRKSLIAMSVDRCLWQVITDLLQCTFYPRDAMLARVIAIATCPSVCLSLCPSVRLSRAGIVSKRRKLAAWFLHHLVAPRL